MNSQFTVKQAIDEYSSGGTLKCIDNGAKQIVIVVGVFCIEYESGTLIYPQPDDTVESTVRSG